MLIAESMLVLSPASNLRASYEHDISMPDIRTDGDAVQDSPGNVMDARFRNITSNPSTDKCERDRCPSFPANECFPRANPARNHQLRC